MRIVKLLLAFLCCLAANAQTIEGLVFNGITNQPLPKAHVTFRGVARYGAISNPEGRFKIDPIAAGTYEVSVDLPGFLTATTALPPIEIGKTAPAGDLKIKLLPHGVITGHVFDPDGAPMEHVAIEVLRGARIVAREQTDAAGEYRIAGLRAEKYRVKVLPAIVAPVREIRSDGSRQEHYAVTFFPGSAHESDASFVEVFSGSVTGGIDIRLISSPVVRVSGIVTGIPAGVNQVNLRIYQGDSGGDSYVHGGRFTRWGLAEGKYLVSAMIQANGQTFLSAPEPIEVGSTDIDNLQLNLLPEFEIAARITWDGTAPEPQTDHPLRILLQPWRSDYYRSFSAEADPTGLFHRSNMAPNRYTVAIENAPASTYVKSIALGSQDMPDNLLDLRNGTNSLPVTLQLSTAGAKISGNAPAGATIALVNDTQFRQTKASSQGAYSFTGLHPGAYKIFRLEDPEDADALKQTGSLGVYEKTALTIQVNESENATAPDLQ